MTRNPLCDTKKLCHTALLPVQLVHLLEHEVVLQRPGGCYVWEIKMLRIALIDADNNDVMPIATTGIAVNQALKLQKINLTLLKKANYFLTC